ncbi:MAG TPA: AAA family ATPase [Amoebophilaceae bacterium]|nr:AAA family ATPase [Amoebophilaceae bacterium]
MENKQHQDASLLRSTSQRHPLTYTGILPITKTNIEDVITSGYYEDKTIHAWRLLKKEIHTFLIRPRRFGKSLFIDTLDKICQGETHAYLFQDCCIGKEKIKLNPENEKEQEKAYDWKQYPVIRLDFSELSNDTPEILELLRKS